MEATAFEVLRNGVVLAELGGYGDGPYCAEHGKGTALVVLGTYIIDPGEDVPYDPRFVFKPGRKNFAAYLADHVAAARPSGARVAVSVCANDLADNVEFLQAARDTGADIVSYCAHSTMAMFLAKNTSSALCRREFWPELRRWAETFRRELDVPCIFKLGYRDTPDTLSAVEILTNAGIQCVHVNVHRTDPDSVGLEVIAKLKGKTPFLLAGGGIKDLDGARRALAAGADAVAVGTAAMHDPTFCGQLQKQLNP